MKKFLYLFITFSFSLPFYGQNRQVIDSLLQITESDITDQERVDAYIKIAFEHVGSDSTGANFYITKALKIAESIGYSEGRMDAFYVQGRSALLSGDYSASKKYLTQLLSGSLELNYKKGIANAHYGNAWLNYYQGKYDESIENHLKSLEIRNTLGDKIDISDCLRGIGITYKLLGEFDRALDYLNKSLDIEIEINNQGGIATSLNHIGIINSLRGDYSKAMDIYFRALVIEQELDDKSGLAYTFQNMGVIYDLQEDYTKALDYYNRSLSLREEIGERRGVAQIINNMGIVYHALADYEKALEYYQKALDIKESLGDKRGVADGNLNVGKLLDDQGRFDDAIAYKKKALRISNQISSDWGKVGALISLGRSYKDLKRYGEAKSYLLEGIRLATEVKLIESVREGARLLALVEKKLGHFEDAYEAQILFQEMSDSISNVETTKRITLLEAQFEFQKERDSVQFANEKERLLLDQRIKEQRTTQLTGLIIVVVLIVVILVMSRYYRLKTDSNKRLSVLNNEIQSRNESLSALNEEKNNLISVVAHDLQNPLSGIIGAVDLLDNKELEEDQKKLMGLIKISSSRMLKMITDILNVEAIEKSAESMNIESYNLSEAVTAVCDSFSKQADAKQISINASIASDIQALVDERYAVQIIENLVSNAIKFSPEGKQVEVKLSADSGKATLVVSDEGPGLNDADKAKLFQRFQRLSAKPTGNESSTGLGLSIVKQLVEKMGGAVRCESELGKGASFFVEFSI
ncbi:MAG: tetratricopeptide repeat-containing sensor histidine kinase [Ekhidna sp.]